MKVFIVDNIKLAKIIVNKINTNGVDKCEIKGGCIIPIAGRAEKRLKKWFPKDREVEFNER